MVRILIVALVLVFTAAGASKQPNFEGIWKAESQGKVLAVLTILSDHPPRGTFAKGEGAMDLYIQDVRVVKSGLRFKTIDPNDGVVQYELKLTSPVEGELVVVGKDTLLMKRK